MFQSCRAAALTSALQKRLAVRMQIGFIESKPVIKFSPLEDQ
jgi:hypothetical protein